MSRLSPLIGHFIVRVLRDTRHRLHWERHPYAGGVPAAGGRSMTSKTFRWWWRWSGEGPNVTVERPPTRRSHCDSTIHPGSSVPEKATWPPCLVNASKTMSGGAPITRRSRSSWSSALFHVCAEPIQPAFPHRR
jgi:hypothetical protein